MSDMPEWEKEVEERIQVALSAAHEQWLQESHQDGAAILSYQKEHITILCRTLAKKRDETFKELEHGKARVRDLETALRDMGQWVSRTTQAALVGEKEAK